MKKWTNLVIIWFNRNRWGIVTMAVGGDRFAVCSVWPAPLRGSGERGARAFFNR
jgi:hypothetical protein